MRCLVTSACAVVVVLLVASNSPHSADAYTLPAGVVSPTPWPQRVQFRQDQFNTLLKSHSSTMTYYDATMGQMRDQSISKPNTDGTFWNGTTLYIFNSAEPFGESCQKLDMGFGIPVPDWFLTNSSAFHTLYQSHKYNTSDMDYHKTLWTRKYSVPGVCSDCGTDFNYYSVASSGEGFKLEAPSPFAEMVNELTSWVPVSGFEEGIMGLPPAAANVTCVGGGTVSDFLTKLAHKIQTNNAIEHERDQFHMVHSAYTFALIGGQQKKPAKTIRMA